MSAPNHGQIRWRVQPPNKTQALLKPLLCLRRERRPQQSPTTEEDRIYTRDQAFTKHCYNPMFRQESSCNSRAACFHTHTHNSTLCTTCTHVYTWTCMYTWTHMDTDGPTRYTLHVACTHVTCICRMYISHVHTCICYMYVLCTCRMHTHV